MPTSNTTIYAKQKNPQKKIASSQDLDVEMREESVQKKK